MSDLAIRIEGLHKTYGTKSAVNGINLTVGKGEIFALLGPNGAGKTTTVEILEGHRIRSSGEVSVLGFDPGLKESEFKQKIGIVLQSTGVEPYLTVKETLELFAGYYRKRQSPEDIMEITGLSNLSGSRVKRLSGGQQRRLDVAVGLVGDPDLFFLDEPTTGFDPSARRSAWQMISNLRSLGKTIFLTTHYMDEAQSLADRVAIMINGKIVKEGSPPELTGKESVTKIRFYIDTGSNDLPADILAEVKSIGEMITIETSNPEKVLFSLTDWSINNAVDLKGLTVSKPSLEEIYIDLVNGQDFEEIS